MPRNATVKRRYDRPHRRSARCYRKLTFPFHHDALLLDVLAFPLEEEAENARRGRNIIYGRDMQDNIFTDAHRLFVNIYKLISMYLRDLVLSFVLTGQSTTGATREDHSVSCREAVSVHCVLINLRIR